MTTYSRAQIEQKVFVVGSSSTYANFLVSSQAAEQVVVRVRNYLRARGVRHWNHPHLVVAQANERWPGTYTAEVRMPGIPNPDNREGDEAQRKLAMAALKAAIKPGDIAQSWSQRPRR